MLSFDISTLIQKLIMSIFTFHNSYDVSEYEQTTCPKIQIKQSSWGRQYNGNPTYALD